MSKTKRTEAQNAFHYRQTARHKIHHIEKALKTAGGQAVAKLQERLAYWRTYQ
jgi:hypothetical protein